MSLGQAPEWFRSKWTDFSKTVKRPEACVYCGHPVLWWNGTRERSATVLVDGVIAFLVGICCPRVKCGNKACQRSWTLRPEGLTPCRQYQLSMVAHGMSEHLFEGTSLESVAESLTCSRRTVSRWLRWMAEVAEPSALCRELMNVCDAVVLPKVEKLVGAAWSRMRALARRAVENLSLLEVLGAAQGMTPPGLACVVERAIANRDRVTTYRSPIIPDLAR